MIDQNSQEISKPRKGDLIFTTANHMTKPANELIGVVHSIDGGTCLFTDPQGCICRFLWRFNNGFINNWHRFESAKSDAA